MKVYVVENKYEANVKIFIVDNRYETKGGACFITSVCVEEMGLSDCCHELTILRDFRDTYLASTEKGRADIAKYYEIGPQILKRICARPDASLQLRTIFWRLILPAVKLTDEGHHKEAFDHCVGQLVRLLDRLGIDRSVLWNEQNQPQ
jgi:hypothetical protein